MKLWRILFILELQSACLVLRIFKARVRWFLSIDENDIPDEQMTQGLRTFRSIKIGSKSFEFSGGFTDLHVKSFEHIMGGEGFGLDDAKAAIETVSTIRTAPLSKSSKTTQSFRGALIK